MPGMLRSPPNEMHRLDSKWPAYWAAFFALSIFLQSAGLALSIPRGLPPDEMAHIAYVRDASTGDRFFPDYANGEILESGAKNYLQHPPLYYSLLGIFSRAANAHPVDDYVQFRILSAAFVAGGFFFCLLAFRNLGIPLAGAALATLATCAIPMFGYLTGSINNDTLAYLGVALTLYGISRLRLDAGSSDTSGFVYFSVGVIVAFLTKATVASFVVFFLAALAILCWKDLPAALRSRRYLYAMAAIAVACGGYYLFAMHEFGSVFPRPRELYAHKPPESPAGLLDYFSNYAMSMWQRLPVAMSHASIAPIDEKVRPAFYAMLLLPIAGWLISRRRAASRGADPFALAVADALVLALAVTAIVHVWVTYKGYLLTGLYSGLQPRYFLFAVPAIWLIFFLTKPAPGWKAVVSGAFAVSAAVAFWSSTPFLLAKQPKNQSMAVAGHIDEVRFDQGRLFVRGWAFDTETEKSPRRIWVAYGDIRLGSMPVGARRPDVAKALKISAARKSGYAATFDGLPQAFSPCHVALFAEVTDTTFVRLAGPDCSE